MAEEFDDLISTLPTEILLHILSFLPDTRLCAKASTLSKRWRHLSSHCPVIRLPPPSAAQESPTAYITAVDGCLAAYRPTAVQSLEIHLPSSTLTYTVPDLWDHLSPVDAAPDPWALASDRWMRWAGDRSVRHLRLTGQCYPSRGWKYAPDTAIPNSVFSPFLTLTSLHLSRCYFHSFPNSDDRFRVLKELTISDTLITNRGLGELLQCCPVLEILELHRCLWAENLKLDAKALTKLTHIRVRDCEGIEEARAEIKAPYLRFFSNDGDLSAIVVKDAPFLHEARLHGCPGKPFVSDKMALLSSSIALVESLSVDDWIFRVMKILVMAAHAIEFEYYKKELSTRTVTLKVTPTLTIGALKSLLEPLPWMPKENLLIVLRRGSLPLDDDNTTLDQCGVKDRDTLLACMHGSFTIDIQSFLFKSFPIVIGSCFETVGEVKEKICREKGYAPEDQVLYLGHDVLRSDETPLVALGVVKPYLREMSADLTLEIPKFIRGSYC